MQRIPSVRAIILFDDVSDDYRIDDGTEFDENYVQPKDGDSKRGDAMPDYCCSEVDPTDNCFHS